MEGLKYYFIESLRIVSWGRCYIYAYLTDKEMGCQRDYVEVTELGFEPQGVQSPS